MDFLDRPLVVLQAPDADSDSSRLDGQLVPEAGAAAGDAAGDDRPVAGDGERAVDGHPEGADFHFPRRRHLACGLGQRRAKLIEAGAGVGACPNERSVR
jgi:hypothetical protein